MSNLSTVQRIYGAFGVGDVATILTTVSDAVEWEHDARDHGVPWLRPGRGKGHVLEFLATVATELEITRFDVENLLEGGSQVVAIIRFGAHVRSTNRTLEDYELHVWSFDEDGKVARFRHVVDTLAHRAGSRA